MFIDSKTHSKILLISGDVSDGSENDIRLKSIIGDFKSFKRCDSNYKIFGNLGDSWRELTGCGKPIVRAGCSPGYE